MNLLHPWTLLLMLGGYPKRLGKSEAKWILFLARLRNDVYRVDEFNFCTSTVNGPRSFCECKGGKRVPGLVGPPSLHRLHQSVSLQPSGCKDPTLSWIDIISYKVVVFWKLISRDVLFFSNSPDSFLLTDFLLSFVSSVSPGISLGQPRRWRSMRLWGDLLAFGSDKLADVRR